MTAHDMNQYVKTLKVVQDENPVMSDSFSVDSNPSSLSQGESRSSSSHTRALMAIKIT